MANFDLRSWLTGYIFSVVGKELKLPALEHPAVQWRLSPSIITTDGAEANDRVWGFSNIDDEFLLVTTSASKLYQSYDGISWNYVADIPFSYTNDIMRVNGVYYNVPTYSKTMYYSEDLITWTACSFPTNHPVNTVKSYQYSAGKFICTSSGVNNGTSGTYLYYSNDGKSWYAKFLDDSPYSSSSRWGSFSVNYYPEIDIWLGIAAVSDNLYYSIDGISWYYAASNVTYTPKYNNGVFLYFSRNNDANPRYHEIYKSEDGKKWRCVYHEDLDESVSDYASLSFTCLNDIWYMSSDGLGTSFRSVDNAETWEPFDELPDVYDSVTAFGKLWLSNYDKNSGLVSVDGESWDTITDARITSAAIDKDFALYGVISYSTDGINWYDTNMLTIKQEIPSGDGFSNVSPIKFKNVWVSSYYKSMGNLLDRKYYESRLLYLPVLAKEPTAYSYNGVVLPKLPEVYDAYPYKYIVEMTDGSYVLVERSSKKTVSVNEGRGGYASGIGILVDNAYTATDGEWKSGGFGNGYIIWSNTDVYYGTSEVLGELAGTLYMYASEPVTTANGANYNGVELPKLPSYSYQHKVIWTSSDGSVYYFTHAESEIQYRDGGTFIGCIFDEPCQTFELENNKWVYAHQNSTYAGNIVWANHNIPNLVDGGVYRDADSDPSPVYE